MCEFSEDTQKLFDEVNQVIWDRMRSLMEELWRNWTHMGLTEDIKILHIRKLGPIQDEHCQDVSSETNEMIRNMKNQIVELKAETEKLSKMLSVDIPVPQYEENQLLFQYLNQLEERIAGHREQMEQRVRTIERLLEWQKDLADKLGVTIQKLSEVPLPTEEEIENHKAHLEVLQAERDKRTEAFLKIQVEIKDIMDQLEIEPQSTFEHSVVSSLSVDFKVTDINMDRLAKFHQDLQEKYEQTNNRVLELRERLVKLWDCLEEDQIYRESFLEAHPGCRPATELAIKEEIKRCEQIKRQKIQVFVANMRTKIKLMWDNVMFSQAEREEFVHYFQDFFSEDTLTLHELYLDKITKYYNENKHIFDLLQNRRNLWMKMCELEARASEPGRYHNRGGQLLKEEKERKAIVNNLPKIEGEIRELVQKYEAKSGKIFTVDGKPVLQLIEDEWEEKKAERHNKVSARKQALTPTARLLRSLAVSPLGKRNRTAAGLPPTADTLKPPTKRQLITGSATKATSSVSKNLSAFKRSAITSVKRRSSGRLASKALSSKRVETAKRKLDYDDEKTPNKMKPKYNIRPLKHKSVSRGRKSGGRNSLASSSTASELEPVQNPLLESTLLTTYTHFKDLIDQKQISRSSLAVKEEKQSIPAVPKPAPRKGPITPQAGKENIQYLEMPMTPKTNLLNTPTRLTRSAVKVNGGFATPRAPLSAAKSNMQRQRTADTLTVKAITPNNVSRSKSHTQLMRAKNLPPMY